MTTDKDKLKAQFLLDAIGTDPDEDLRDHMGVAPSTAKEPMVREHLRRLFKNRGRRP